MVLSKLSAMEGLPLKTVETIARHLSVTDLAACCACSHTMRELFCHDVVWKCRCDQDLAEHLRITPCRVTPGFVSPEAEDTTLSGISPWRLAYMRENHFKDNWRQGRYKTVKIHENNDIVQTTFLLDRYLVVCHFHFVKIIDPGQNDSNNRPLVLTTLGLSDNKIRFCQGVSTIGDIIVIVCLYTVQVYHFEVTSHVCSHMHTLSPPDGPDSLTKYRFSDEFAVANDMFVGFSFVEVKDALSMHIWNIHSGLLVKVEDCPDIYSHIYDVNTTGTMDIILLFDFPLHEIGTIMIYSLDSLQFLPFKLLVDSEVHICNSITGSYLCVMRSDEGDFDVYNYQTSQKVLSLQGSDCLFIDNVLLFVQNQQLKMFDINAQHLQSLGLSGVKSFTVFSNRFVEVNSRGDKREIFVFDCNKKQLKPFSLPIHHLSRDLNPVGNRFGTICVMDSSVLLFW